MQRTHSRRLEYLDSIRGIAALTVVLCHFIGAYGLAPFLDPILEKSPLKVLVDGYCSVSLFFVLSGFVLSLKFFSKNGPGAAQGIPLLPFALARVLRILVPYLAVLILSAFAMRLPVNKDTVPAMSEWARGFWSVQSNWISVIKESRLYILYYPFVSVPQAWTLGIELLLSIAVPVGVLIVSRGRAWLAFFTVLAIQVGAPRFVYHFALGIAIAQWYLLLPREGSPFSTRTKFALFIAAFFLYAFRSIVSDDVIRWVTMDHTWYYTGTGAAVLIVLAISSPKTQKVLNHSWLRGLGKISYSLYLCHLILILRAAPAVLVFMNKQGINNWLVCWFAAGLTIVVGSLLLATLLYHWVEKPSIAWSRKTADWLARRDSSYRWPIRKLQPQGLGELEPVQHPRRHG